MYEESPLINNEASHSFEMMVDGQRAFICYRKAGEVYQLIHTEVPELLRQKGLAKALVAKTFNYLQENNQKMRPYCAYIQAYLKAYPVWKKLIAK